MSSGFFDELERQLIEAAAPLSAGAALRGRDRSGRSQLRSLALRARRARAARLSVAVPALAAMLIGGAIAVVTTLDSEHESPPRTLSGSREQPASHRFKAIAEAADWSLTGAPSMIDADTLKPAALTPLAGGVFGPEVEAGSDTVDGLRSEAQSARIAQAIDAAWEGRACSGCYVTDEATLRGQALGSLRRVRSIAVHVGGENLKRICVWLIAPDGKAAEGSTCSTNALLAIGGTHSREDAALTQGFGSSGEEIAIAGGT